MSPRVTPKNPEKNALFEKGAASGAAVKRKTGARDAELRRVIDAELKAVIDAWPALPESARRNILKIIGEALPVPERGGL